MVDDDVPDEWREQPPSPRDPMVPDMPDFVPQPPEEKDPEELSIEEQMIEAWTAPRTHGPPPDEASVAMMGAIVGRVADTQCVDCPRCDGLGVVPTSSIGTSLIAKLDECDEDLRSYVGGVEAQRDELRDRAYRLIDENTKLHRDVADVEAQRDWLVRGGALAMQQMQDLERRCERLQEEGTRLTEELRESADRELAFQHQAVSLRMWIYELRRNYRPSDDAACPWCEEKPAGVHSNGCVWARFTDEVR